MNRIYQEACLTVKVWHMWMDRERTTVPQLPTLNDHRHVISLEEFGCMVLQHNYRPLPFDKVKVTLMHKPLDTCAGVRRGYEERHGLFILSLEMDGAKKQFIPRSVKPETRLLKDVLQDLKKQ